MYNASFFSVFVIGVLLVTTNIDIDSSYMVKAPTSIELKRANCSEVPASSEKINSSRIMSWKLTWFVLATQLSSLAERNYFATTTVAYLKPHICRNRSSSAVFLTNFSYVENLQLSNRDRSTFSAAYFL